MLSHQKRFQIQFRILTSIVCLRNRSEDESANEYEVCTSPTEEIEQNWQEVIR